jgi:hypothetical protein
MPPIDPWILAFLLLSLVGPVLLTILYSDRLSARAKRRVTTIGAAVGGLLVLAFAALFLSWRDVVLLAPFVALGVWASTKTQICDRCGHYQHNWWPLRGPRQCYKCGLPTGKQPSAPGNTTAA